jgi:hypothetical protein
LFLAAVADMNPRDCDDDAIINASYRGHVTEVVRFLLADPRVNPATGDDYAIRWHV